MISQFYRFVVVNNSGQLLTFNNAGRINVKNTGIFIDPATGLITYDTLADDDLGFVGGSSLADGVEIIGDVEIDNTGNKFIGLLVQLEIIHDEGTAIAAAGGSFDLYISVGDATGDLQTDAAGYDDAEKNQLTFVGLCFLHGDTADDQLTRSNVFAL